MLAWNSTSSDADDGPGCGSSSFPPLNSTASDADDGPGDGSSSFPPLNSTASDADDGPGDGSSSFPPLNLEYKFSAFSHPCVQRDIYLP